MHKFLILIVLIWQLGGPSTIFAQSQDEYIIQQMFKLGKSNGLDALFTPDNRYIVTLSEANKIELRNSFNGALAKAISTGKHKAISILAHPNQPQLITGGEDHTIHLWDIDLGTTINVLRGHTSQVNALAVNAEGSMLVSGSDDGAIIVWDLSNAVLQSTMRKAHQGKIHSLTFHPNGALIASGGKDRKIRIWNMKNGKMLAELKDPGEVTVVLFHPDGKQLVSASRDKTVKLWNWQDKYVESTIKGHTNAVTALDLHQNGAWILSGSTDGTIKLWAIENGEETSSLKPIEGAVQSAHFDNSGKRIVAVLEKGSVYIWNLGPSSFMASLKGHTRSITTLDFTKNGKYLLSSALDKSVKVWSITQKQIATTYDMGGHRVQQLKLSGDSRLFATAGADSKIGLWETQSGQRIATLSFHKGKVNSLDFHPRDPILLSGSSDRQWALWDLNTRTPISSNLAHSDQITVARFSPDGTRFATGSNDKSIQIWSYPEGRLLTTLQGHRQSIRDVAFSPVAPILASASSERVIKIWNIDPTVGGELLYNLSGHTFLVSGIEFSADGKVLISASRDKTVRLWDVDKGNLIRILSGERDPISTMALRPDGKLIALGTLGNEIVLLDYPLNLAKVSQKARATSPEDQSPQEASDTVLDSTPQPALSDAEAYIDNQDDLEEVMEALPEADIFELTDTEDPVKQREMLQQDLNMTLKKGEVCKNAKDLEQKAWTVLKRAPNDKAAYHALLKVAISQIDVNLIFLFSKIGTWAEFAPNRYTYNNETDVNHQFRIWTENVFDQALMRRGDQLVMSLENCNKRTQAVAIPQTLYLLDIPMEFIELTLSKTEVWDGQLFKQLSTEDFKNRLLQTVLETLNKKDSQSESTDVSFSLDNALQVIPTGQLHLNLTQTQLWGEPNRLLFQLRERSNPWQSYYSASDKQKALLLPTGQYYLKVGGTIRRAFTLSANQEKVIEGADLR